MIKRESKGNASRQTLEAIATGEGESAAATDKDGGSDDDPDPYANASSSDSWSTTTYVYDVTAPYYEVLSETTDGVTTAYEYGVERISAYENIGWSTLKTDYVYDGRGSVAQELTYNSSWYTFGGFLSNKGVNSYTYTPFGELLTGEGSGFRFNGEDYDSATGMLNLRARQYEPGVMRFGQRDVWHGMAEMPTSQNRYLYCLNDPIGYYDHGGDRADEGSGVPEKIKTSTSASKAISDTSAASLKAEQLAIRKINSANQQLDNALKNAGIDTNNTDDATKQTVEKARKEIAQKAADGALTASERDRIIQAACTTAKHGATAIDQAALLAITKVLSNIVNTMILGTGLMDGLFGYDRDAFGDPETYYTGKLIGDIARFLGATYTGAAAITEILLGGATTIGGGGLTLTGAGTIVGVPAMAGGAALIAAGISTVGLAVAVGGDALTDFRKDWDAYQNASEEPTKEPMGKNKGNAPRNNQAQNKQVRDVETELGLSKEEVRILHDEISGQGYNYNEILELAKSLFGK